eukprot:gene6949-biopygen20954
MSVQRCRGNRLGGMPMRAPPSPLQRAPLVALSRDSGGFPGCRRRDRGAVAKGAVQTSGNEGPFTSALQLLRRRARFVSRPNKMMGSRQGAAGRWGHDDAGTFGTWAAAPDPPGDPRNPRECGFAGSGRSVFMAGRGWSNTSSERSDSDRSEEAPTGPCPARHDHRRAMITGRPRSRRGCPGIL